MLLLVSRLGSFRYNITPTRVIAFLMIYVFLKPLEELYKSLRLIYPNIDLTQTFLTKFGFDVEKSERVSEVPYFCNLTVESFNIVPERAVLALLDGLEYHPRHKETVFGLSSLNQPNADFRKVKGKILHLISSGTFRYYTTVSK